MKVEDLRSPYQKVAHLYHLGRMLDKIRLQQADRLPAEYLPNFGLSAGLDLGCRAANNLRDLQIQGGLTDCLIFRIQKSARFVLALGLQALLPAGGRILAVEGLTATIENKPLFDTLPFSFGNVTQLGFASLTSSRRGVLEL